MDNIKKIATIIASAVTCLVTTCFADVVVKNVTAQQRYPWNGKVDIVVTMEGASVDVATSDCTFTATNGATGGEIRISDIMRNGTVAGPKCTWTRRFIWDASADIGSVKIDDVVLTVNIVPAGVQLWENGPYWAECNVGARKPEEYGYYFWWGDTVGYKRNAANNRWVSAKDGTAYSFSGCPTYGLNNSSLQSQGYIDSTGNLVAAHDAATAHLGAPWRMPTDAEMSALINNCDTTWTTRNGVAGRLVTGRGAFASKSIFIPAAGSGYDAGSYGRYWSSTPCSDCSYDAWYLIFSSGDFDRPGYYRYGGRDIGQSVRPLRGFAK